MNYVINEKSKEVMIKNDVPEKLHNIVIGIIICITTDIERKYDKAKFIVESESINLSDTRRYLFFTLNSVLYLFPLLLCKMSNPKQTRNRYQLSTGSNLNYVRFAMVIFIIGFVLSSVLDKDAFSKCMKVYNNSDICYKLN